jgi:hypothetical protein
MGLFTTVIHVYKRGQPEIVTELSNELNQNYSFLKLERIRVQEANYKEILSNVIYSQPGIFDLVTLPHGAWTTIIELNVNIDNPVYLSQLAKSLSRRLDTYILSFHLHDSDVLYYNRASKQK